MTHNGLIYHVFVLQRRLSMSTSNAKGTLGDWIKQEQHVTNWDVMRRAKKRGGTNPNLCGGDAPDVIKL